MQQVHIFISGFVQGVGFREFVKREARKLGVFGWTRNLADRRVEILAQGEEEILKKFITICSRGPFLSEVRNISIDWQEIVEEFSSFDRRPTE